MTCLVVHAETLELLRQAGVEPIVCPKHDVETTRMIQGCDAGRIFAARPDLHTHGAPLRAPVAAGREIFTPHIRGSTEEAIRRIAAGSVRNVLIAPSGEYPARALNDTVRMPA